MGIQILHQERTGAWYSEGLYRTRGKFPSDFPRDADGFLVYDPLDGAAKVLPEVNRTSADKGKGGWFTTGRGLLDHRGGDLRIHANALFENDTVYDLVVEVRRYRKNQIRVAERKMKILKIKVCTSYCEESFYLCICTSRTFPR